VVSDRRREGEKKKRGGKRNRFKDRRTCSLKLFALAARTTKKKKRKKRSGRLRRSRALQRAKREGPSRLQRGLPVVGILYAEKGKEKKHGSMPPSSARD